MTDYADGVAADNNTGAEVGQYPDSVAPLSPTQGVLSPTTQETLGRATAYGLPGIGLGFLDTLGQSLGVLHNDTIENTMKRLTGDGPNSFGDFYSRDKKTLQTVGDLAGMFLPGLAAVKMLKTVNGLREAGSLGSLLKNSSAMDILLGNSANMTSLETKIAQETVVGSEAQGIWAGRSVATPAVQAAKRSYYAARAIDAARTTAAFEVGNYAAYNSSDTFYPADYTLTDQLKWAGVGLAGGVALDLAAAKYAVRNIIQTATKDASNGIGSAGPNLPTNPVIANASSVIFRPNARGVGITAYAIMQNELNDTIKTAASATLKSNSTQDLTNIKAVLATQIKGMAYDTHVVLPRVSLTDDQIKLGLTALDKDPNAFLYAKKLANVPEEGTKEFYTNLNGLVEKAQRQYQVDMFAASNIQDFDEQQAAIKKANDAVSQFEEAGNQIHYVIESDGRYSVYKNRADNWLDNNSMDQIKRKTYSTPALNAAGQNVTLKNSKLIAKADNDIILHDNFRAEIPKGATPNDYSLLYAMGSKMINDWKPVEDQTFILTPELNWRTTEMTLALAERQPQAAAQIKLGGGFTSINDAKFHVLNEKIKEFNSLMPLTERAPLTGVAARVASLKQNYTPAQVLQRLNLPEPLGFQPSPVVEMAAHMKMQNMSDLNEMFPKQVPSLTNPTGGVSQWEMVNQHLKETLGIADQEKAVPVNGPLLNQKDVKPLFVAATGTPPMARADAMIASMVQVKRDVQLQKLSQINAGTSPLVSGVIGKIVTGGNEGGDLSGAANTARAVQTLQDGLVSGSGQVVYQDQINNQFPTLKAAQLLAQDTDKFVDSYVSQLASANLTPSTVKLLNPKNKADLFDFNRIEQSYRHGWDIQKIQSSPTGAGTVFELNPKSAINAKLIAQHFPGEDPESITHLPDMSVTALKTGYTPLVVSNSAATVASAISDMSIQSGVENNALRSALGKTPITIRDFHLPTPELSRTGTWFVRNDTGNVIATYTGDLESSNAQRAKDAAQKLIEATGAAHVAVPLDTVRRDHAIFDDNFFSLIDYSDQLAKTGAGIKGGLARTEIDTGDSTLKAMIKSLQQQYLNIGIRSRAAVFEPELNYAKQASQMAPRDAIGGQNIFDRYISTMFSQSPTSGRGIISNLYAGVEGGLDKALSWLSQYHTELAGGEANIANAKISRAILRRQSSEEEFNQFKKVLPEWSPFDEANKWAESTFKEKMPWTARPAAAALSRVSSTLALRFLDVGTAINNFAGLMANSPSVVMALRKLPTETTEQWINRTAAWGTNIVPEITTFSPMKAMNKAIRALWSGELNAPMADAAKHGYFDPEYTSLGKVLSTPVGNQASARLNQFVHGASYLADKSEIMTRQIAWGMGYKIGKDLHGFTDEKNAYIFANNFVNEMIGNYSPNNKPAMFQGALGLPLGAFQTYMFNSFRRMYGIVERGDKAAAIAQYAAQSALFGAKGVPGFAAWNSYMTANSDGSDDFQGRLDRNLAPGVSELILNGSISNIPKIYGLNKIFGGDGLAFYTRGSIDMTDLPPTIMDMNRAPPIQFLAGVFQGVQRTVANIFSHEKFSIQEQEEILATSTNNRFLKSVMEMAANAKTDGRGEVIQMGTRDAIHSAAALLGTRPSSTQRLMDASNREKQVQLTQEALRADLNDKTRAMFRGGEFGLSDMQGIVKDYIKSGGNPAYLGQWFRNNMVTSMTPKAEQKLEELGRSGKMLEFENMLAAMQQNQSPNTKGK